MNHIGWAGNWRGGWGTSSRGFCLPWGFEQPWMGVWEELGEKEKPRGGGSPGPLDSSFKPPTRAHGPHQCGSTDSDTENPQKQPRTIAISTVPGPME